MTPTLKWFTGFGQTLMNIGALGRTRTANPLIRSGVPLKQASEALGHSSIAVTADVYGHLLAPSTATADAMAHVMYGT